MESTFYYKQQINSKITIAPTFKQNITGMDNFDKNQDNIDEITIGSIVVKLDGLSDYEKENLAQMAVSSKQLQEEISKLQFDISHCTGYCDSNYPYDLSSDCMVNFNDKKDGTYEQACKEYDSMLRTVDNLGQELSEIQLKILTTSPITNSNYYKVRKAFEEKMVQEATFSETIEPDSVITDTQETTDKIEDEPLDIRKDISDCFSEETNKVDKNPVRLKENKEKTKQNKFNIGNFIKKAINFISIKIEALIKLIKNCVKSILDIVKL